MATAREIPLLEDVIKLVAEIPSSRPRFGEHFVSVKAKTGDLITARWILPGTKRYIYRVLTEDAGGARVEGRSNTIHVKDLDSGDSVSLVATFVASCPVRNVEPMVVALGAFGSPDDELKRRIDAIADQFLLGRERKFFESFERLSAELAQELSRGIEEQTGLNFRAQVSLAKSHDLSPHNISQNVEVRFADSQQRRALLFECDLDVISGYTLLAIVTYDRLAALHSTLIEAVSNFFRLQVPVEEYASGLRDAAVLDRLRDLLDRLASKHGRCVNGLTLTPISSASDHVPPSFKKSELVTYIQPLGRSQNIPLQTRIQLTRRDLALFQKANIGDFDTWLQSAFDDVVQIECFKIEYLRYLQSDTWSDIAEKIKAGMTLRAKAIGYDVEQIFSAPAIVENEFSKPDYHPFELSDLPLRSTSRARVGLTVATNFYVPDWSGKRISQKINQGIDLKGDIRRELSQALSTVLATVNPNDFMLGFGQRGADGTSIEEQLVGAVRKTLTESYDAEVLKVAVTPVENDDVVRVRGMLDVGHVLEFETTPYSGPENLSFKVTWRVCGFAADSWDKISRPECNLDSIEAALKNALVRTFNGIDLANLYARDNEATEKLERFGFSHPRKQIAGQFGVELDLSNLTRLLSESEINRRALQSEADAAKAALYRGKLDHVKAVQEDGLARDLKRRQEMDDLFHADFERLLDLRRLVAPNEREKDELKVLTARLLPEASDEVSFPDIADVDLAPDVPKAIRRDAPAALEDRSMPPTDPEGMPQRDPRSTPDGD